MQHNQYNSPMQLYSTENAEEQYRLHANQYAGMAESAPPGTLGSGRRQFDPQQSETLRLIQEESNLQNGQYPQQDFFDKVAVAEEPRVPADQQPQWVSEARDRSTRARSHTPNSRQFLYRNDPYDGYLPSGPPPVFTTDTVGLPTVRYNSLPRQRRSPSRHTPVPGASERGYLFGGMDFIDHSRDTELFNVDDDYQDWMQRRSRKDQERRSERPGHKFGLDFNSSPRRGEGIAYDENYQGYTAQYPRKVWHFAADPLAPCNTYVTDVVECVDPVRLVGDTLSNHRIPMERPIPDEEKNNLGTAFSPTPGFTYEHRTVRPQTPDPEPVCYSLSVKKHLARADNYTPPRSQSVGANQYRADRYRGGVTQAPLDATTFANRQALLGQGNLEGEGGAVSQQPPHQSQAQWDSQASQQSQAQWNSQTGQTQQRYATGQQQHIGQPHAAQQHSGQSRDDQRQFNQQRVDQRQVEQRNVDQRQFEQRTVGQQQGARQPAAQQHVDRQQYTAQSNQQQGGQWQANNQQQQGAQVKLKWPTGRRS
ncbi:ZASP domain-containing protein [Aphelenchoides fujianensis]|nr:ZASP domain-containing protein [Aphelenchoides fujianensis]